MASQRPRAYWAGLTFLATIFPALTLAQTRVQGNYTALTDVFWQLANLTTAPEVMGKFNNPNLGGQNFTHCCLLAVNDSLQVVDGYIRNTTNFILSSVDILIQATENGQFPCTATWSGNDNGAPVVSVPYSWYSQNCPGWELSDSRNGDESQWIQPFVGFLLPAIVFCVTIPRRRKLAVWEKLFIRDMSQVISWLIAPLAMMIAGFIVTWDTVIWLSMCFAFAGPMLLSGLYEAFLDNAVIGFLREKTRNGRLTTDMRARLLFVILVGNLDLDSDANTEVQHVIEAVDPADGLDGQRLNQGSAWTHVENLVYPLRTYGDMDIGRPRQQPLHDSQCLVSNKDNDCYDLSHLETRFPINATLKMEIGRAKTRLRTMLACQYSFGSTVGAPVVFFLGGFVSTLLATTGNLGDEDTSLALAFGIWYMIIPHISIVSGLLLAGNNPNTLEGVVALEFGDVAKKEETSWVLRVFELAYDSRYKPKWLWERGKSKRDWIQRVWETYGKQPDPLRKLETILDKDMDALRTISSLKFLNWVVVVGLTLLLMSVPFLLAFLTAFFTPEVGLSCRSLTFLVYAITQLCQIVLWLWAYAGIPRFKEGSYFSFIRQKGWLYNNGFYNPTNHKSLWSRKKFFSLPSLWALIWYILAALFVAGGVVTSIVGTMLQLMGVYNSSQCEITAWWWTRPHGTVMVIVSSDYALEISEARKYWVPSGITAMLFLGAVSFCGWWHQRRLRHLFREQVRMVGMERARNGEPI